MRIAIICTAFGTSRIQSLAPFYSIVSQIKDEFDIESVHLAFSSSFIRKKLLESNVYIPSPVETVESLLKNHEIVIILPFQIVAGAEYEKIVAEIEQLPGSSRCYFCEPLIRTEYDLDCIIEMLVQRKNEIGATFTGLVVAGHGNGNHPTDDLYVLLDNKLSLVNKHFACATLETNPSFEMIASRYIDQKVDSVLILPLLFSAGKHILEDIAGNSESSWVQQFQRKGIEVFADQIPLGEQPAFIDLWMNRLRAVLVAVENV